MYICIMKKDNIKSKRLEFDPTVIKKINKKAKKVGSKFKPYAEALIINHANND